MSGKRAREQFTHEEFFQWPGWVPGLFLFFALTAGVSVIVQRQVAGHGLLRPVMFAVLVLLPFTLEGVAAFTGKRVYLPRLLFPVPVLAGMGLLMTMTPELEFAPFVLVVLCAQSSTDDRGFSQDRPWYGVLVMLASCGLMVGGEVFGPHDDSFIWCIGIFFGWFGGFSVQRLATQAAALKRANAELAERSAAEERQRIAREVHDVIAHSLSVTMLHVTAARMALERGDRTSDALEALREAEEQGRKSLTDIRRTVGLLGPDEPATAPPLPTAADLPKLVQDFRTAGLDATLLMNGHVHALEPAAGLNLYRIVQESLTNVAKHAPGAEARVELTVTDDDVRLRVHNSPGNGATPVRGEEGGLGLRGMAERAALLGGTLAADSGEDGWTVFVHAPRQAAEAT